MINGLGVVGWGVGGIEAEAAMLGQPVYFLTPDVVGFEFTGKLREGVTATDLVLTVTEMLRKAKVVGKFVEFYGAGAALLSVPDRATLANMAPEYGATMGFFSVDDKTVEYLRGTGRTDDEIEAFEAYFRAQGLFGTPASGSIDFSESLTLDLSTVAPSLAGPKRPQDRIEIGKLSKKFDELLVTPAAANGYNLPPDQVARRAVTRQRHRDRPRRRADRGHHQLHQHQQPERDAGRRPAREEGRRGGAERQAAREDVAGAGLAHRHRVPDEGRPAAGARGSSASTSRPTAAPPASATPATSRPS